MPDWLAEGTQEVILGAEESSPSKIEWRDETDPEAIRERAKQILRKLPVVEPTPRIPLFEQDRILTRINNAHEFDANANGTGVIILPTFNPNQGDLTGIPQFYAAFSRGVKALQPLAKRVIIDVRGNTGGSICLSIGIVEALFPEIQRPITNFRYSSAEAQLIDIDWVDYDNFATVAPGSNEQTSPTYLKRTVAHKNRQSNFTNYLTEYCTRYSFPKLGTSTDPTKPYHPWTAENIAIFSDGGCGSACAIFAHQLEQKRGVKTVVVGGNNYTEKMSYASFPGGQVTKAEDHYYTVQRYLKTLTFDSANEGSQSESAVAAPEQQQQQKQQQKPLSKREEEE
ncbi:hypothetical protein DFQ27_001514, partial [Actinomortierella ambigua]